MPKKRKNGGKNRHNRGNVKRVTCDATGKRVAKDKAVKRFYSKPMLDAMTLKDVKEASVYEMMKFPRLHTQQKFCVSEAQHHRVIRKRPSWQRKDDNIPKHVKQRQITAGRLIDAVQYDLNPRDYRWMRLMRSGISLNDIHNVSKYARHMYVG